MTRGRLKIQSTISGRKIVGMGVNFGGRKFHISISSPPQYSLGGQIIPSLINKASLLLIST